MSDIESILNSEDEYDNDFECELEKCEYCGELVEFDFHEHDCPNQEFYWIKAYACGGEGENLDTLIDGLDWLVTDLKEKRAAGWIATTIDNGHIYLGLPKKKVDSSNG